VFHGLTGVQPVYRLVLIAAALALLASLTVLFPSYGHGTVDQQFQGAFNGHVALNSPAGVGRLSQTFTPARDSLNAIDLFITRSGFPIDVAVTVTARIEDGSGTVLGSATALIPASTANGYEDPYVAHFDFNPVLALTLNAEYRIVVDRDSSYSWASGSGGGFAGPYARGAAFVGANPEFGMDFGFRTYYGEAAPTPTPTPTPSEDTTLPSSPIPSIPNRPTATTAGTRVTSTSRGA
jgi:hypothetical protein